MIARIWRGRTSEQDADAYLQYLERTGVKDHRSIEGNRGDYVMRKTDNGVSEFLVISLWESFESIRKFAGPDPEVSVYYPEDEKYLLEMEPKVSHYQILLAPESERSP
jgi:heme-degrading monooxygenase HmoA